jgi:hypothetical protein
MGFVRGKGPRGAKGGNWRREKKGAHRGPAKGMTTLGEFGRVGAEEIIFPRLRAGDFHLGQIRFSSGPAAGSGALRRRAVAAENSDGDFEPHAARRRRTPPAHQRAGHRLKFYYATQVRQSPPTFLLFVNRDELFSDQYKKYLAGEMRAAFGYEGCPIVLVPKARPKTIEPMRKFKPVATKPPGKTWMHIARAKRGTKDIPASPARKNRAENLFTAANKSPRQCRRGNSLIFIWE